MDPVVVRRRIAADPDEVFAAVTDLARLPEWNRAVTRTLELPRALHPGAEWVVEVTAFGQRWPSRSRLVEHDPAARRFAHRSGTDDGNPSYADWVWTVTPVPGGCEVAVTATLAPRTFWRRLLLARVRRHQLARREVPDSLAALAGRLEDARPQVWRTRKAVIWSQAARVSPTHGVKSMAPVARRPAHDTTHEGASR